MSKLRKRRLEILKKAREMKLGFFDRARGMRTWYDVRRHALRQLRAGFVLSTLVAIFVLITMFETQTFLREKIMVHFKQLEETWISCLNGNGVYLNDSVHLCSITNTYIERGNNLK